MSEQIEMDTLDTYVIQTSIGDSTYTMDVEHIDKQTGIFGARNEVNSNEVCSSSVNTIHSFKAECSDKKPRRDKQIMEAEYIHDRPRRCNRKRATPSRFDVHANDVNASSWTEDEKKKLLLALKKHGIMNMKHLCEAVPTKNEARIKTLLNNYWKKARMSLLEKAAKKYKHQYGNNLSNSAYLAPIDQWLNLLKENQPNNYDEYKFLPIARTFLFISKFESHPDPSDCGGVDFGDMYEFLHNMLCGYPFKQLSFATASYIIQSMEKFASTLTTKAEKTKQVCVIEGITKVLYQKKKKEHETDNKDVNMNPEMCIKEMLKLQGFNPFDIPLDTVSPQKNRK